MTLFYTSVFGFAVLSLVVAPFWTSPDLAGWGLMLIMGSVGATFIVIGIGLMYVMTGTLNMTDLAEAARARARSTSSCSSCRAMRT